MYEIALMSALLGGADQHLVGLTQQDGLLAGAQFRECTLENVVFERVIASIAGMAPEKMDDWYRALSMLLTSMEHVRFSDCDLRGGQMEQCTTTYTVMENTLAEASDFAILLPNI